MNDENMNGPYFCSICLYSLKAHFNFCPLCGQDLEQKIDTIIDEERKQGLLDLRYEETGKR